MGKSMGHIKRRWRSPILSRTVVINSSTRHMAAGLFPSSYSSYSSPLVCLLPASASWRQLNLLFFETALENAHPNKASSGHEILVRVRDYRERLTQYTF